MSESLQFREPVILGLPPSEHPLFNPETKKLESAFEPQPGEEIPPADILAGIFPSKDEPYLPVPDTLDEIKILRSSIKTFYDRSSPRSHGRLNAYQGALNSKEDSLDPPYDRYLRTFKQEISSRIEVPEDFHSLLETLFVEHPRGLNIPDEDYQRLSEFFYNEPSAIALVNLFIVNAQNQGHIRKDWYFDRLSTIYPPLSTKLRECGIFDSGVFRANWFSDVIRQSESVFQAASDINEANIFDHDILSGRITTTTALEGIGWALFAHKYHDRKYYMDRYDYEGFHDFLSKLEHRLVPDEKEAFTNFELDTSRIVVKRSLGQQVLSKSQAKSGLFFRTAAVHDLMAVLQRAAQPGDGYFKKRDEFKEMVYQHLGINIDTDNLSQFRLHRVS